MIEFKAITADGAAYREQVFDLYEEAFPREEKKPRALLEDLALKGRMELLAITDEDVFVGLAMNMFSGQTALLDYFAVAPDKRDCGYGGRAVQKLQRRFQDKKYIFEIEIQDGEAENAEARRRRKAFYLRNGLKETGVFVNVYHTDFELLTPDGQLTFEEYTAILRDVLGEEGIRILKPQLIGM